jgi:hypothetical protein
VTTEGAYRTVYKAVLMHPMQTVDMPVGSRVVTVETQGGQPCIWYECDPSAPSERRTFTAIGTGHLIPPGQEYVGTSHDVAGAGLVFHVYEQEPPTIGKSEQS